MAKYTILVVGSGSSNGSPMVSSLRTAGCELVTAKTHSEAVALLYVNRRIDAVMLEACSNRHSALALAGALRSVRPEVPVLLVSPQPRPPLSATEEYVYVDEDSTDLLPVLNNLFSAPVT